MGILKSAKWDWAKCLKTLSLGVDGLLDNSPTCMDRFVLLLLYNMMALFIH